MHSTLYILPEGAALQDAALVGADPITGGGIVHGAPGTPVPDAAIAVFYDGSEAWTWMQLAVEHPSLCSVVMPQEWSGENTAAGLDLALFPRLAPGPAPEVV